MVKTRTHLPPLPLASWQDSKTTLHLFAQIVGKIRLSLNPPLNHWWHVPLYVSTRGLTTLMIPTADASVELEFDFTGHHLLIHTSRDETRLIPLQRTTVASFYEQILEHLADLNIYPKVLARPFDPERVKSDIPFREDQQHDAYEPDSAHSFWRILIEIEPIFRHFRGAFLGKCSPVHFFWHSFDLAVTRFSGKKVELGPGVDVVTREAYSHEVISAGFWPGDDTLPEPAFYAYAAPEPGELAAQSLRPSEAWWRESNGSHLALYRYEDFRKAPDPAASLMEFLQSSYEAGAELAGWPRSSLERHP